MNRIAVIIAALWLGCCGTVARAAEPRLQLVTATYFGSGEDDDLQGAATAADGSIYIAGNTDASIGTLPGGTAVTRFGEDAKLPRCGHAFIAHLSSDGKQVL